MGLRATKFAIALAGAAFIASSAFADDVKRIDNPPADHPLDEIISGYEFRTTETQGLQDDDFENPGFLWVEQGEEAWNTVEGEAGKSCASCHGDASESMADVGATYPKWNEKLGKPVNVEQQINLCRTNNMKAEPYKKWDSNEMLAMNAFVKYQAKGKPVNIQADGPMAEWMAKGKEIYYTRVGQLDMACANCHEDNYDNNIRSDHLSQGHINGFPVYRLKWQKLGSSHRRFKGCMKNIRATPYKVGSDEFLALETYLAWRGNGLSVESPSVRN